MLFIFKTLLRLKHLLQPKMAQSLHQSLQFLSTQKYRYHLNKFQSAGLNLGEIFNSRRGCKSVRHLLYSTPEQPNLALKIWPKKLLVYFPIAFKLPEYQQLQCIAYEPNIDSHYKKGFSKLTNDNKRVRIVKVHCNLKRTKRSYLTVIKLPSSFISQKSKLQIQYRPLLL